MLIFFLLRTCFSASSHILYCNLSVLLFPTFQCVALGEIDECSVPNINVNFISFFFNDCAGFLCARIEIQFDELNESN